MKTRIERKNGQHITKLVCLFSDGQKITIPYYKKVDAVRMAEVLAPLSDDEAAMTKIVTRHIR